MNLKDKATILKGIGPKNAKSLEKIGIELLEDFLYYFPRSYQDRRHRVKINELTISDGSLIKGNLNRIIKGGYGKRSYLRVYIEDDTGSIEAIFFNAMFLLKSLRKNQEYELFGRVTLGKRGLTMVHPEISLGKLENSGEIIPIYPLTEGISQNSIRKWQREVASLIPDIEDYMPKKIVSRNNLCSLEYALNNIHFPIEPRMVKEAAFRLVFDELLILQLGLLAMKKNIKDQEGIIFSNKIKTKTFIQDLPFKLTKAQSRVIDEIEQDMEIPIVMNRLVQGDVGSGKTIVAAAAAYKAIKSGFNVLFMAPTEILAVQHYESLKKTFKDHGIDVALITGSIKEKDRKPADLTIGTHALIQEAMNFEKVGLVITDEQHRFGVNQRKMLALKGQNPDILVMTATPIPRTLAMILYGDLDHSVIDEMPPFRKTIMTKSISPKNREKAYKFLKEQVKEGRQAYIVSPLIEESERIEARSSQEVYEEVKGKYPNLKVAWLHGNMKQTEKDETMKKFSQGEIDILVSTLVIEVGINVPNATVMLIENAERFGLATLHQLRGRVGRGDHQSYCILISDSKNEIAKERARILEETSDGFIISEKDLELRGPGEFFGLKQHGIPRLKIADLSKHKNILITVHKEAKELLSKDPELKTSDNVLLKKRVEKLFREQLIF